MRILDKIESNKTGKESVLRTEKNQDLRKNPKIRVLHNMDDPILSPDDRVFLDDVLKEKLTWFDCGGHMGNLYLIEHQQKLCELLGTPGILPKKEE